VTERVFVVTKGTPFRVGSKEMTSGPLPPAGHSGCAASGDGARRFTAVMASARLHLPSAVIAMFEAVTLYEVARAVRAVTASRQSAVTTTRPARRGDGVLMIRSS